MLKIYIGNASGESDYTKYVVDQSLSITKSLNVPTTCALSLANKDGAFVLPAPRSYIRIYSTKYQRSLFTGFITNDPARTFLGAGNNSSIGGQLFTFALQCTSDEYLLNIKNVGFIPTFVNQPKGYILRSIAETLCPGFYDFTYCASGDIVPSYTYDPTQSWAEIAKTFADASRYRYSAIDKQIHFQPYGDGPLGVVYDEDGGQGSFDPYSLATAATTTAIVNDVTVIGQQEAGNNHEDNFIGDGFTGAFPLKHKVFGLAAAQSGNSILLSDSWSAAAVNTQNWNPQDPSQNFFYGANNSQALNILTGVAQPPGTSFIAATNALELAGGVVLQHGEFVFNDVSYGVLGGVYDSQILNSFNNLTIDESTCEAGFRVTPTASVTVTASGAAGIAIQPFRQGTIPTKAFNVITKVNCSYVLTTTITAPAPSRYTQVFRTLAGVAYGGTATEDVQGSLTWSVVETNLFTGVQTTYTYTLANQTLPSTAIYVLIDNYQLNITLTTTTLSAPIPGSLNATCKVGAGLLAPIYVSGIVQYTGAFVTPSGGNLPILPGAFGPENNFALGTSLQNQAAELDSGQVTDTLNFYGDDLPGVGVRVRLQTWESQAAVSRVQDPVSVAAELAVVGDNGIRSSIVTNLNPLPRTSEDCDFAGQAFLADRVQPYYQGTYKASSLLFFKQLNDDIDFYPTCGRYLYINSPRRNIVKQNFVVTAITSTVVELVNEVIDHAITFGPDLYLDKLLDALVPQPTSILMPSDTVVQPPPQSLSSIGSNYLADVQQTTANSLAISGASFVLSLNDVVPQGAWYEIRNADLNWGNINDGRLVAQVFASGNITLQRSAYDQSWFIRLVTILNNQIISSRRTKVIRIVYPRVPLIPAYVRADSSEIYLDFNGDVRNIEGVELRGAVQTWTASTLFTSTEQIIDSNGNVQQVIGTAVAQVASSAIVPGPAGAPYNYAMFYLTAPLTSTGPMYTGQTVGFSGLRGPGGQLIVLNDEPYDTWPLTVLNQTLVRTNVFGVPTGALVAENATMQSIGVQPGATSGPNAPIWNTNSVNTTGALILTPAYIQGANGFANASGANVSFASPNTLGNCIVAVLCWSDWFSGYATSKVTDSNGNIYTRIGGSSVNNVKTEIWVALNCVNGSNIVTGSATPLASQQVFSLAIHEYRGVATVSALDAYNVTNSTGSTNTLSGSLTTTQLGDLLLIAGGYEGGVTQPVSSSLGTARQIIHSSGGIYPTNVATFDSVLSSIGAVSTTLTWGANVSESGMIIAALKAKTVANGISGNVITVDGSVLWANLGKITPANPVYYQAIVGSEFDMDLQLGILRGQLTPGQTSTGPIGQFQINLVPPNARSFIAYFFNLMWDYSPGLSIYIPPPQAPTVTVGYSFGSSLQLVITPNDPVSREDIVYTNLQVSNTNLFSSGGILADIQSMGAVGTMTVNVPVTGALYARAQLVDQISSGAWSNTLLIPQGNLISSAYLAGQGSVPPAITNSAVTSGGIFTYTSTATNIMMASVAFGVIYPNGAVDNVPASTANFTTALDSPGALLPSTPYGFFPALKGPTTPTPTIAFDGPYLNFTTTGVTSALVVQQADGSVPLTNGSFTVTTAIGGGTAGGGGGGTGGGGNCGEINSKILCSDGVRRSLKDINVGQLVKNIAGRLSKVAEKQILLERTVAYKTQSGLSTESAYGHVLCSKGKWLSLAYLLDIDEIVDITVLTDNGEDSIVELVIGNELRHICKLALDPLDKKNASEDDHVYNLDGFWAHNGIVKNIGH